LCQGKDAPSRAKRLVKNKDVIFATVRPTLKRLTLINEEFDGEICSTAFCVLRATENILNPLYLFYAVQRDVFIDEFEKVQRGASYPAITDSDVKNQKIPLPPLPEQHRIAAVLSAVQDVKEKTEAVIAAAKLLKKSLMRHLFTYGPVPAGAAESVPLAETEVGLVPEGWEVTQLGVICNLFQYGTSKRCHLEGVGIPVLRIPNVINGRIDTQELKYINLEDKKAEKLRLSSGDLLFVRTNGQRKHVGRCSIYKEELRDALFASYLIRAKLNVDVALPEYIQSYTMTQKGQEYLSGRASGAADGKFNINQQILKSVLVPLPPPPEQHRIASILSTVDKKIEAEENKKKAIDELFKSLLHNLMSAKIRVNHLEVTL
jgi:type I restriction enzyme S subunit